MSKAKQLKEKIDSLRESQDSEILDGNSLKAIKDVAKKWKLSRKQAKAVEEVATMNNTRLVVRRDGTGGLQLIVDTQQEKDQIEKAAGINMRTGSPRAELGGQKPHGRILLGELDKVK